MSNTDCLCTNTSTDVTRLKAILNTDYSSFIASSIEIISEETGKIAHLKQERLRALYRNIFSSAYIAFWEAHDTEADPALNDILRDSSNFALKLKSLIYTACKTKWDNIYSDIALYLHVMYEDLEIGKTATADITTTAASLTTRSTISNLESVLDNIDLSLTSKKCTSAIDSFAYGTLFNWYCPVSTNIFSNTATMKLGSDEYEVTVLELMKGAVLRIALKAAIEKYLISTYLTLNNTYSLIPFYTFNDLSYKLTYTTVDRCTSVKYIIDTSEDEE